VFHRLAGYRDRAFFCVCGAVILHDGEEALRESRRQTRTLERFLQVPAPGVDDGWAIWCAWGGRSPPAR
jgi:hypothetical protein